MLEKILFYTTILLG